jgi:hypothetical protein
MNRRSGAFSPNHTAEHSGDPSGDTLPSRRCHGQWSQELWFPTEHQCGQRYMLWRRWRNLRRGVSPGFSGAKPGFLEEDRSAAMVLHRRRPLLAGMTSQLANTTLQPPWKDVEPLWRTPQTNPSLPADSKRGDDARTTRNWRASGDLHRVLGSRLPS